jgi:hypothetical protein
VDGQDFADIEAYGVQGRGGSANWRLIGIQRISLAGHAGRAEGKAKENKTGPSCFAEQTPLIARLDSC